VISLGFREWYRILRLNGVGRIASVYRTLKLLRGIPARLTPFSPRPVFRE